ncbi:MAG: dihydrofolate reductase family protein [Rhodospirillales bacterium]|nr:dihydrofolate reductase family protein [Rhodospirillales bacterium]
MTLRLSVFIATSLDGFIARSDGDLDWLDAANELVTEGEDCGFHDFMESCDALIMGRKTYEKVLSFGSWPYGSKKVIVLSRNKISFPSHIPETVSHSSETPDQLSQRLSSESAKRLYIDGGNTIQRFLAAGLINDLTITVIPVVLGQGIPLFGDLKKDIPLKLVDTRSYDFGFVQLNYDVVGVV